MCRFLSDMGPFHVVRARILNTSVNTKVISGENAHQTFVFAVFTYVMTKHSHSSSDMRRGRFYASLSRLLITLPNSRISSEKVGVHYSFFFAPLADLMFCAQGPRNSQRMDRSFLPPGSSNHVPLQYPSLSKHSTRTGSLSSEPSL